MANFQGMLDRLCKSYAGDSGKMLLHMGALAWFLNSAAHIFMVTKSKHIEKDKKKFLLWQEALDGVVNVGLYYTLTDFAKKGADWVVENRRMPKSTIDAAKKFARVGDDGLVDFFKTSAQEFAKGSKKGLFPKLKESGASGFYKKAVDALAGKCKVSKNDIFSAINQAQSKCGGDFNKGIASLKGTNKTFNQLLDTIQAQREFRTFKNGIGTAVSILASVLAVSIITPIVRNKLTNRIVKHKHEAPEDPKVFYNAPRPLPLAFKNVGGSLRV